MWADDWCKRALYTLCVVWCKDMNQSARTAKDPTRWISTFTLSCYRALVDKNGKDKNGRDKNREILLFLSFCFCLL